jgi:signal transduction histidine kinase
LLLVAGAVYVTGGEKSWFFWLPLIRVFDQSMYGFKRSISFVLASTGVFMALWLYLWLFEHRPIDVTSEIAKTVFVGVSGFYIALTSRAFERVRNKLVSTVRFARHAMVELRDKTEALSNASRRAQQNSQAKSEFLARVSHELRRPATSVIGFAQLLEMDELKEKPRDYAARILRSGQELGLMIDEVMDMAEMQSGSVVLAPRSVLLSDVVDEALAQVWPISASRGVRLLADENADTTLRIWSDPRGLRRVLINTIAHAVRYSGEGDRVFVTWARQGEQARIMVRDSGHGGLSESDEQVLARGGRLDEDITRLQELGLGLAFVKALVISLNGQVGADLAAREGATYWIDMPLTGAPTPEPT